MQNDLSDTDPFLVLFDFLHKPTFMSSFPLSIGTFSKQGRQGWGARKKSYLYYDRNLFFSWISTPPSSLSFRLQKVFCWLCLSTIFVSISTLLVHHRATNKYFFLEGCMSDHDIIIYIIENWLDISPLIGQHLGVWNKLEHAFWLKQKSSFQHQKVLTHV